MEPANRALNDPARLTETAAMRRHPSGDFGLDPLSVEQAAVLVMIVTAVGLNNARLRQRAATLAANGRDRLNQGRQLGDIVAVGARQKHGKRDALCFGDQGVLGAGACAIGGMGSCF